jgi:hypothetical protein
MTILLVAAVFSRVNQTAEIRTLMPLYVVAGHAKHVRADRQVTPRSGALWHFDTVASAYGLRYPDAPFQKIGGGESKVFLRAQAGV